MKKEDIILRLRQFVWDIENGDTSITITIWDISDRLIELLKALEGDSFIDPRSMGGNDKTDGECGDCQKIQQIVGKQVNQMLISLDRKTVYRIFSDGSYRKDQKASNILAKTKRVPEGPPKT